MDPKGIHGTQFGQMREFADDWCCGAEMFVIITEFACPTLGVEKGARAAVLHKGNNEIELKEYVEN
jgi:hypothetical protein